jgi:hypothetical protein
MESGKLKKPEQSQLCQKTLKTKLEAPTAEPTENETEQVEQQWNTIKQAVIEAAIDTIGEEERTRNGWYDEECREAVRENNEDRLRMLQRTTRQTCDKYKESRKKANKIIHSKKKAHLKKEIENIELLTNRNFIKL